MLKAFGGEFIIESQFASEFFLYVIWIVSMAPSSASTEPPADRFVGLGHDDQCEYHCNSYTGDIF